MPLLFLRRGSSEDYPLVKKHPVPYFGRFSYYNAHPVVYKKPPAYFCAGVYLYPRQHPVYM
jgi:hypothetical protein